TLNARDQPPAEVSDQRVSGLTGAVQLSRLVLLWWWVDRAEGR
ncbi:transposase, partial [Mycobacterium tuberculosis]